MKQMILTALQLYNFNFQTSIALLFKVFKADWTINAFTVKEHAVAEGLKLLLDFSGSLLCFLSPHPCHSVVMAET